ncbi:AMP-binding protein [Streptomyces sp. NBRC 110028]|uniref:AMP-binding protein n=1 Tax=Streptomyces sp. NBRC 110028 TaxID=1621260 RepID=UPI00099F2D04
MPENVISLWQIWGLDLRECYGLTETVGCPVAHFGQTFPRPGYIGRKFPDPRFQVEVAHDGEMLVRAPLLFREYWRNPKETAAVLQDGWFRTGDLIERTAHGEIRLIGRKKDVIIASGGKYRHDGHRSSPASAPGPSSSFPRTASRLEPFGNADVIPFLCATPRPCLFCIHTCGI